MIDVNVKLFAIARDLTGRRELTLSLPHESSVTHLLESLIGSHPRLLEWKGFLRFAVNRQYVSAETILNDGDEVAVIPPVSGG